MFDLRLIIGGRFTFYGVVLIIAGLADGPSELRKASGIRINFWAGLGMLILGLLFLLWMSLTGDGHERPEDRAAKAARAEAAESGSRPAA